MPISTLPYYEPLAAVYATIFIGFGILYFVNVPKALSFFEISYPDATAAAKDKKLAAAKHTIDTLSVVYGVRDMYMGAALYAAAWGGTRTTLGWILLSAGSVAAADGAACRWMVGKGEWNHWSYAPVLLLLGVGAVGGLDWVNIGV